MTHPIIIFLMILNWRSSIRRIWTTKPEAQRRYRLTRRSPTPRCNTGLSEKPGYGPVDFIVDQIEVVPVVPGP